MAAKKKPAKQSVATLQQQEADQPRQTAEPGDINSSLSSDRMKALLEDHRKMGSRP